MSVLIAEKIEMTQHFTDDGTVIPVTILHAGPCTVTQVKIAEKDGVNAIQLGFQERKASKTSKPLAGHLKGLQSFKQLREFAVVDPKQFSRGQQLTVDTFKAGDKIKATGISKGQGFQGVVKRHGFHGHPATHGHKDQLRTSGSIGAGGVQRVIKGMRMAGRMGGARSTARNLTVVSIDPQKNILYVKGAVPGARHGILLLQTI